MKFEFHIYIHDSTDSNHSNESAKLDEILTAVNNRSDQIMATLAEVQSALADLQSTSDSEHEQAAVVLQKVTDLEAQVAALQAQIAAGTAATPADLDGLLATIGTIKTGISNIVPDATTV